MIQFYLVILSKTTAREEARGSKRKKQNPCHRHLRLRAVQVLHGLSRI